MYDARHLTVATSLPQKHIVTAKTPLQTLYQTAPPQTSNKTRKSTHANNETSFQTSNALPPVRSHYSPISNQ